MAGVRGRKGAVVAVTGQVAEVDVVGFFEPPVADEARLVAHEDPLEVVEDVRLRACGVPDPDLVERPQEGRVIRGALERLTEAQRAAGRPARIARADAARLAR